MVFVVFLLSFVEDDTFTEVVNAVLERSMLERTGNFATARKLDEVTEHRHLKILLLMTCLDIHI